MSHQETMTRYLLQFIQGLLASHVTSAVISPGSRSTPLALLLHREPAITTYIAVDERSAGFFALGLSKAQQKPVALLCTSGTAAANYYPAICEAQESQLPLIVLTTDRPHELRQVGAPQAMDQLNLFQGHVKLFVEMALPEASPTMLNYAYWQGLRTVQRAAQVPAGPVHLNFPLREPLLPDLTLGATPIAKQIFQGEQRLSRSELTSLADAWSKKRGVLIVGGSQTTHEALNFIQLAETLGWPILSDPLANILTCGSQSSTIIASGDLLIQELPTDMHPEIILQFGLLPLSKNLMLWLSQLEPSQTERYFIDESGQWQDQLKQAQTIIQGSQQALIADLVSKTNIMPTDPAWLASWKVYEKLVQDILATDWQEGSLTEAQASLLVHQKMAPNGQLFVANSMPIRYLDRYMTPRHTPYQLYGNRGINGIDGVVSTALGMTAANPNCQNVLLVGDLTLYHDMNGLLQGKKYQLPLTIVLLNNNGGGIFSFLSQNQLEKQDFEPLFGTPLDLDFALVAQLYEGNHHLVKSLPQLSELLESPTEGLRILEVQTQRQDNVQELQALSRKIRRQFEAQDEA